MKRQLTDREINAILCALHGMYADDSPRFCSPRLCDHFDEEEPLTKAEMQRLASQLWLGSVEIDFDIDASNDVLDAYRETA